MAVKRRQGSVLVMVVVVAAVLFVLTGVAYTYFQMSARSYLFRMRRTRAATAAEAGTAMALHYLSALNELPVGGEPFVLSFEGDSSGWNDLPGTGKFFVVIDPVDGLNGLTRNGAVEIRSRGLSGGVSRDIEMRASPAYPSSYALLVENDIPDGYFIDGRVVNGPVHSNGVVHFNSYSPDSTGDPSVAMVSSSGGFSFSGVGQSDSPHPQGSNVWVRPYSKHRQGAPYWRPSAPEIDFARMMDYFRRLVSGSLRNDAVYISAQRILLQRDRILFKEREDSPERTVELRGVNLVVVRNGFAPVMVKSISPPGHPLTIVAMNDLVIAGSVDGGTVGSGGPLGLVSLGDIYVAADPDETGGPDWPGRWSIETSDGFFVRACLAAPSGALRAEVPYVPEEKARLAVTGSLAQKSMGRLSMGDSGYTLGNSWDTGLGALHPPYFPMLGRWNVYSWIVDPPDREGFDIEDNRV